MCKQAYNHVWGNQSQNQWCVCVFVCIYLTINSAVRLTFCFPLCNSVSAAWGGGRKKLQRQSIIWTEHNPETINNLKADRRSIFPRCLSGASLSFLCYIYLFLKLPFFQEKKKKHLSFHRSVSPSLWFAPSCIPLPSLWRWPPHRVKERSPARVTQRGEWQTASSAQTHMRLLLL